ncbi:GTPase Era [Insolitispirillum peregrinum]|uniref:GTPase Era n=1 Tax=Insolitispirillum peregrinum TaxID=80876 RepID=A0A1N7IXH9_9PROT|nr:GTPase Era [Insolitispirillum peregrinum]SIS41808.1 GTP-binding protein Era [Insolitispirillum peregrinum]
MSDDVIPTTQDDVPTRCGFVAVLGAPNAGKSTLTNAMVGTKVSIVSPKVQTTRTRIRGIAMQDNTQIIFIDTPGIFRPKKRLERAMVAAAWAGLADADTVMLVIDVQRASGKRGLDEDSSSIIETLKKNGYRDVILVLNKVDLVNPPVLLDLAAKLHAEGIFSEVFMISALKERGTADILRYLASRAPLGPYMFPEDEVSDLPMRMLAAEITREKVFLKLYHELPYSITVETDKWTERPDGSVKIDQTIFVARDSQKSIVLGKGGDQIKHIGAAARKELEEILGQKVHLFLFIKVREDWAEDRARYSEWGLDFDA